MKRLVLLMALLPLAQVSGPALQACHAYAEREIARASPRVKAVVLDDDRDRNLERSARKLGSQFVSSLLYGNGAIVNAEGPAVEMSWLCLLADDRRAVFFHWLPRRDAPVLAQCRRSAGEGVNGCLEMLQQLAEQDLAQAYAQRLVEARHADAKAGNEDAAGAFRRSADAWRAYREAECARRDGGDAAKTCLVELTRRRAIDLR